MLRVALLVAVVACSSSAPKPSQTVQPANAPAGEATPEAAPHAESRRPPPPPPPPDAPPDAPSCPVVNPKGCPATEPNVNRPCAPKNIECIYDSNCCHWVTYVCAKNLHFEAHIQRCP
jgi:hypothetical protein